MTTFIYTINDINKFISNGNPYRLPEPISKTISELNKLFVNVEPISTKPTTYEKKPNRPSENETNDWSAVRTGFKTTKVTVYEGIEKDVNTLRASLNKISAKNYEMQQESIIDFIRTFLETQEFSEISETEKMSNIHKIGQSIFDLAIVNKNNSGIYAALFKTVNQTFNLFNPVLTEFISNYRENIKNIQYIAPNANYDKFCENIKQNDLRKSSALFLIHLMKIDVIDIEIIIDMLQYLQEIAFRYIEESGHNNEVEEIVENVFILISQGNSRLKLHDNWAQIIGKVRDVSIMNPKEQSGISNKAIFKCLDTMDSVK